MNLAFFIRLITFKVLLLSSISSFASTLCDTCSYEFRLGASAASFNSQVRFDSVIDETAIGDNINLEDDLGVTKDDDFIYASLSWQFLDKHSVKIDYAEYTRSAQATSTRDYQFGQDLLLTGSYIDTEASTRIKDIAYTYDFYTKDRLNVGALFGVYWSTREFKISANGIVVDEQGVNQQLIDYNRKAKVDIPLPTLGLTFGYQLSPDWELEANLRSLKVNMDNRTGNFTNLSTGLRYKLSDSTSMGLALTSRHLKVTSRRNELQGKINWAYQSADVFFVYQF